jgi:hypothetical protein
LRDSRSLSLWVANCKIRQEMAVLSALWYDPQMRDFILLLVHLLVTLARLTRPGGIRSVLADSVRIKHQLLILNRSR